MKALILSLLLTSSAATMAETHLWVFGDSLSGRAKSWPAIVDQYTKETYVKSAAQNGLSYSDLLGNPVFSVPDYLLCHRSPNFPNIKVVVWLGSNDAISGTEINAFRSSVDAAIAALQAKQCEFYIVLPPMPEHSSPVYAEYIERRTIIAEIAAGHGEPVTDLRYNWKQTTDGLHPTELQSWILAGQFIKLLDIKGGHYEQHRKGGNNVCARYRGAHTAKGAQTGCRMARNRSACLELGAIQLQVIR